MGWIQRTTRSAMSRILSMAILLGLILVAAGIDERVRSNVWIYVDNGDDQPMQVSLDGSEKLQVPAHEVGIIKTRGGHKQITARMGRGVVFDHAEDLTPGKPTRYVLDPGMKHRYFIRVVNYGLSIPSFGTYYDQRDRYMQIARRVNVVPAAEWFEAQYCDYVLEPAPDKVEGKVLASRDVLARIDKNDYDLIAGARDKHPVTEDDCYELQKVVDRVLNVK